MNKQHNECIELQNALQHDCIEYFGSKKGYGLWNEIYMRLKEAWLNPDHSDLLHPEAPNILQAYDKPDVLYENRESVLGIECFKFDSSKMQKKGSTMLAKQAGVDRKLLDRYYKTGDRYIREHNDAELSYEEYINSAVHILDKHKVKIPEYLERIARFSDGKKPYLSFYIEDVTIMGNYAITERGKEEPLCILNVKRFLDSVLEGQDLDFILTRHQYNYFRYRIIIVQNSEEYMSKLLAESYVDDLIVFTSEQSETIQSIGL